jgi:hypothetical protein
MRARHYVVRIDQDVVSVSFSLQFPRFQLQRGNDLSPWHGRIFILA